MTEPDAEIPVEGAVPLSGRALASLIIGIVAVVLAVVPVIDLLSVVLGVIAVVLGLLGRKRIDGTTSRGRGLATAGVVLGIVAIVMTVVVFVLLELVLRNVSGAMVG